MNDWKWHNFNELSPPFLYIAIRTWAITIEDLRQMLIAYDLNELIILFDEFENILSSINNIKWQKDPFWNLFPIWY